MMFFAAIFAAYAIAVLVIPAMRPPFLEQRFMTMPLAATLHLAGAAGALVVGPLQHHARPRSRFLNVHRCTARTHVLAALFGGGAALRLSEFSRGSRPTRVRLR